MKLVTEGKLERMLGSEKNVIIKEINAYRTQKKKHKIRYEKDYPAVIIAAQYNKIMKVGRSRSMNAITGNHRNDLHELLKSALMQAGKDLLKSKITISKFEEVEKKRYYFGTCAEDDVADKIIKKYESSSRKRKKRLFKNLNEICFTKARRPRTWEIIPCCDVCQEIFS